jgi:hypothetical protein
MRVTRLRQAVVTAADRDAVRKALEELLELGEPFADPGVAEFGLHNWVFPVGDTFLEIVSPTRPGTTAGRLLDRYGDSGYMAIFQVESISSCRDHLRANDVRSIWNHDSNAIGSTHIHPQDIGGTIVSFDEPRPPGSWVWGGAGWEQRSTSQVVSGLAGITISGPDQAGLLRRWSAVLNVRPVDDTLTLPDSSILRFVKADRPAPVLSAIEFWSLPGAQAIDEVVAGTRIHTRSRP